MDKNNDYEDSQEKNYSTKGEQSTPKPTSANSKSKPNMFFKLKKEVRYEKMPTVMSGKYSSKKHAII